MKGSWKAVPLTVIITDYGRNRLYIEVFSLFLPQIVIKERKFSNVPCVHLLGIVFKTRFVRCVSFVRWETEINHEQY